jgi:hypothetical protein
MKTKYLLPNYFIKIGLVLFILALLSDNYAERFRTPYNPKIDSAFAVGGKPYKSYFYKSDPTHKYRARSIEEFNHDQKILKEQDLRERFGRINFLIFYLGCIFIVCAKLKIEDEYIAKLRLESLIWTLFLCGGILTLFRIYYEFNPSLVTHYGGIVEEVYIPNLGIPYYLMILFATFVFRFNYVVFLRPKFLSNQKGESDEK